MARLALPLLLVLLALLAAAAVEAFVQPLRQRSQPQPQSQQQRVSRPRLGARGDGDEEAGGSGGGGVVDKLFGLFFGTKQAKPLGFDRISVETSPEVYPATTDRFADPLPGDSKDVAALRCLLAQTRIEKKPLVLVYDAVKDGWKCSDFHRRVDNRGAALVVARTRGGAVCGGYNPEGWEGVGDERRTIAAFLFTWPQGKMKAARPIKLPKVGSAEYAVDDRPDLAIKMGYEDFLLKLTGPNAKVATSKLGLGYAKGPGGMASLFAPSEGKTAEIVDLKVYAVKR